MLGGLLVSIGAIVRVRTNSSRYRSVWGTLKLRLELASHHFSVRENFHRTWWFWIKEPPYFKLTGPVNTTVPLNSHVFLNHLRFFGVHKLFINTPHGKIVVLHRNLITKFSSERNDRNGLCSQKSVLRFMERWTLSPKGQYIDGHEVKTLSIIGTEFACPQWPNSRNALANSALGTCLTRLVREYGTSLSGITTNRLSMQTIGGRHGGFTNPKHLNPTPKVKVIR